jgi:hypothetical protein
MDWKTVDERLIRRGELILDLESLRNHGEELRKMNQGRPGPRYKLADTYVRLLSVVRYLYCMPYRQLEGYTRILHTLIPELPSGDYSGLRKRILRLPVDPYEHLIGSNEPVTIAVDSTGISVHRAGGWIERKHGKKRRYVKLHFAVNTVTHEVVSMEVSTDDVHDVKVLPGLVGEARRNVRVAKVYGDGAYDSGKVYGLLEGLGVEAVVKPKGNARTGTGPPSRGRAVGMVRELGYATWKEFTGYGKRWAVETAYSTFKRLFGEHSMARDLVNIARELTGKVSLYNMLVNF